MKYSFFFVIIIILFLSCGGDSEESNVGDTEISVESSEFEQNSLIEISARELTDKMSRELFSIEVETDVEIASLKASSFLPHQSDQLNLLSPDLCLTTKGRLNLRQYYVLIQ